MKAEFDALAIQADQSYWLDGKPFTGIAVCRRTDGTIESEVSFVDGIQSGSVIDWYPNDQMAFQGTIRNGVYHGECKTWNPNGCLVKVEIYEYGICISKKEYSASGQLFSEFQITPADPNFALLELHRRQNQ